jgi:hypothetical protein
MHSLTAGTGKDRGHTQPSGPNSLRQGEPSDWVCGGVHAAANELVAHIHPGRVRHPHVYRCVRAGGRAGVHVRARRGAGVIWFAVRDLCNLKNNSPLPAGAPPYPPHIATSILRIITIAPAGTDALQARTCVFWICCSLNCSYGAR